MKFQTVSIIKHKREDVWKTMRDKLPELARLMDDIESITEVERVELPAGYKVVNIWKSSTKLPQTIVKLLNADMFTWTDRAEWVTHDYACQWTIEMHHFRELVQCHGTTTFEPALGDEGTKVTFAGDLELNSQKLAGIVGIFSDAMLTAAEGIIRNVIQKNFRKITETMGKHLDTR